MSCAGIMHSKPNSFFIGLKQCSKYVSSPCAHRSVNQDVYSVAGSFTEPDNDLIWLMPCL